MINPQLRLIERAVPPKGARRPERKPPFDKPKTTRYGYAALVKTFRESTMLSAEVEYDPKKDRPEAILSGLNSALRRLGFETVKATQRGDEVYLYLSLCEAGDTHAQGHMFESLLSLFDCNEDAEMAVDLPDGADTIAAYHAFHYRRTRLGFGHIAVMMCDGRIVLKKVVDT